VPDAAVHRAPAAAVRAPWSGRRRGVLLFVVTPECYFLSHRLALAAAAAQDGWEVHLATPDGPRGDEIARRNIVLHRVPMHRGIGSPAEELRGLVALFRLCRALRPDLIHAVSPKTAVLGGVVARVLGIPAVIMKGGLGSTVTQPGAYNALARLVVRAGIRAGLGARAVLVVQNPDEGADLARTARMRARTVLVDGAGVDCQVFRPTPEPPPPVTVTLAGRMIRSKGVPEFVAAARLLAERGAKARFLLAGEPDPGKRGSLEPRELRAWTREGWVEWLGQCPDMPGLLARSHIVCLPSHGEGLSKALAEAAAAGRAIVATDVPGCREVVCAGVNGLLVPPRDPAALAQALERLIGDPEMRAAFGRAGREIALARLDERIVIPRMLAIYRSLAQS
jgi:glycosyltransferase involved in cell wall biosynthesis